VARVGDRGSFLLVDALLDGPRRFGDLQEALAGVAPNVRSKRLKALTAEGGRKLEVRGSFGPFGRTQTWVRIQ
jgi:DNA-binding HxlR family transcriptional regulator